MIWALIALAVMVGLLGLGSALRFVAYSVRGVGMTWGVIVQLVLVGAGGIALAVWLFSWTLPQVLP